MARPKSLKNDACMFTNLAENRRTQGTGERREDGKSDGSIERPDENPVSLSLSGTGTP